MILLAPLLIAGVFLYLWWTRRRSTLTRDCRWREHPGDVTREGTLWRCAACGAETRAPKGGAPRQCLRPR